MKKLLILLLIIFLSTTLVYSKGSGEESTLEIANTLIEDKKYNEALAMLYSYAAENPKAIYDVQILIDEIKTKREESNAILDEFFTALYDNQDFETAEKLLKEFDEKNPYPDDLTKKLLKNARSGTQFVINQKRFKEYMDEALVHLEAKEFNLALDKYLLCLDFHSDEFDLLIETSSTDSLEEIDLENIDQDLPVDRYYATLRNSSFKERDLITSQTEDLKLNLEIFIESYNESIKLIQSEVIDKDVLDNKLKIFKVIPSILNSYYKRKEQLEQYNDLFTRLTTDDTPSKFISYASLTLSGRKNTEEGFIYLINKLYPIYIDDIITKIDTKIDLDFKLAVNLYNSANYDEAIKSFNNIINSYSALNSSASLWKSFIKIDDNFNITNADTLINKYNYIGDSQIGTKVIKSYIGLANYLKGVDDDSNISDLENYRTFIVSQMSEIEEENKLWSIEVNKISNRDVLTYANAPNLVSNLQIEYSRVKNLFIDKEILLVDKITSNYYVDIFGFDIDQGNSDIDAMGEVIANAALPTDLEEVIDVYFGINNTDQRSLTTYNPETALTNLTKIEDEYITFVDKIENYINKFENEKSYIKSNNNFNLRYQSVSNAFGLANSNKESLITYSTNAIDKITLSKESENRGTTLYNSALNSFRQEKFNEARSFIDNGINVSEVAISYSKNSYVIDELIPLFYNLSEDINQEEARIVIRDVRKLITSGKAQYLEGAYIPASNLFKEAELKWAGTNVDSHPEIPYWLALIRDALDIESGRYLSITEPLYSILAGYISFAENYYRTGLLQENKVEKLKSFAIADSYLEKVLQVRALNERARFLRLQVLKSKDPEAFKATFSNSFIGYRNDIVRAIENNKSLATSTVMATLGNYEAIVIDAYLPRPRLSGSRRRNLLERFYKQSNQSASQRISNDENKKVINESYLSLKDLYKIAEENQKVNVKRLIDISEVALGFKRLPVDTQNIRASNNLFNIAKGKLSNTNQTDTDALDLILIDLKAALTLNPRNEDIPVVIDDILVMLGEESNFQLEPTEDKLYRDALNDFRNERFYDAKDKIIIILQANRKNKNYPKLKDLINRVEVKIGEEITI
ncbi:MAG: hypothetical protein OCD02_08900 [Spirochaetaceae bacterium]